MHHLPRRPVNKVTATDRPTSGRRRTPRRRRSGPFRRSRDSGFVLLETLLSISLITVVMAAVGIFFVNSVAFTSHQRATQTAIQIANSAFEALRALPASDLANGHDATSVTNQFNAAATAARPWLSDMAAATDRTALIGSGVTASVPTVAVAQRLNNVDYSVTTYLGTCVIVSGVTRNATCAQGSAASGVGYLRAVVAVTWVSTGCPSAGCAYVGSVLLSPVDDPAFTTDQSPPTSPVLANPGAQISAVGDTIDLPAKITAVPSYRVAVTDGALPAGLILDTATGRITGTPSAERVGARLTLTLTDGFGRASSTEFEWTVRPQLTTTAPSNQASFIGTSLKMTLPAATGGSPDYTWTDPGMTLPPGLTVSTVDNQAVITGTPTRRGAFPVTLTVTDSTATRKATVGFTWTTDYPPMVAANPGPQKGTLNAAASVTLSVTGGSGSFLWSSRAALPVGLTLNSAGVISGTPTAAGVTSVALVVTDAETGTAKDVSFSWTVYARPTVASPGNQNVTVGSSVSLQLTTTCPNAPCSYMINNGPATFGINAGGLLTGTVTSTAQTFTSVTIAVTDSSAVTVSSASFVVTVNAAPSISSPGNQTVIPGAAVSLNAAGLTTGGTAPLTYSAANLPAWLTLNVSTGLITGIAPGTSGTTTGTVLTVRDALGFSVSSPTFSWTVGGVPTAPRLVTVVNGDGRVTPSWTAPTTGPVTSYTATVSPGGASCPATATLSCVITGLTNGVDYTVTVAASNGYGTGPASTGVLAIPYPAVMSAGSGMTLWLDGADPTALLGSSACNGAVSTTAVGCWKDKSGAQNNFVQTTAANQPGVATWNGLRAANFADSSDVLNSVVAAGQYQTVFVAANVTNTGTAAQYVNLFGGATQDINVRVGSNILRSAPNGNDWSNNSAGTGAQFNWANGAQGVNASPPLAVITSDQAPAVKTLAASLSNTFMSRGMIGQVGDVITFNRALPTADRRAVEEYLALKWGVTVTPQAPRSVTASRSSTSSANVSWAAPSVNGGDAVSGYTVTSVPGGKSCTTAAALTCQVTGLTRYTAYTFIVTARNAAGPGPASAASNSVTP